MSTSNKGKIPLAQVAQVILELAKSQKKLVELTHELKREKEQSKGYWRDRKGEEFRGKVQEIVSLNTKVGEVMGKQIRALRDYYSAAQMTVRGAQFDAGKI